MARRRLEVFLDSDDEDDIVARRPRWIRERSNAFDDFDDTDFKTRFRLSKQSALSVLERIENQLEFLSDRNDSISPINQLLTTLRFYVTGNHQLTLGDLGGFSIPSANRIVHRVSRAIANLRPEDIVFPEDERAILLAQVKFFDIARFPRVVGALDCTHIKIQSPGGDDAELFKNRKGYFSIICQAICNANLEFVDVVARWPGSVHDSTIFNASYRHAIFENHRYGNAVLLGDSGYACRSYLFTSLDAPQTLEEQLYNEAQIRTRNTTERTFGVWKRRFPVLALGIRVKLKRVFPIIIATAVLHNMLRRLGDEMPPDDPNLPLPAPWERMIALGEASNRGNAQVPPRRENANFRGRRVLINTYLWALHRRHFMLANAR